MRLNILTAYYTNLSKLNNLSLKQNQVLLPLQGLNNNMI